MLFLLDSVEVITSIKENDDWMIRSLLLDIFCLFKYFACLELVLLLSFEGDSSIT